MFNNNLWMGCLHPDTSCQLIILSSYQHCGEQQFQTLSCALYTIFQVTKLDLVVLVLFVVYFVLKLFKNIDFYIKTRLKMHTRSMRIFFPEQECNLVTE